MHDPNKCLNTWNNNNKSVTNLFEAVMFPGYYFDTSYR